MKPKQIATVYERLSNGNREEWIPIKEGEVVKTTTHGVKVYAPKTDDKVLMHWWAKQFAEWFPFMSKNVKTIVRERV